MRCTICNDSEQTLLLTNQPSPWQQLCVSKKDLSLGLTYNGSANDVGRHLFLALRMQIRLKHWYRWIWLQNTVKALAPLCGIWDQSWAAGWHSKVGPRLSPLMYMQRDQGLRPGSCRPDHAAAARDRPTVDTASAQSTQEECIFSALQPYNNKNTDTDRQTAMFSGS